MKRRDFLKYTSLSTFLLAQNLYANSNENMDFLSFFKNLFEEEKKIKNFQEDKNFKLIKEEENLQLVQDDEKKDFQNFEVDNLIEESNESTIVEKHIENKEINSDIQLSEEYLKSSFTVRKKLQNIQNHVGYGHFNLISFDEMLNIPKYINIEPFTKEELDFLEYIFYYDPKYHGFYGQRVSNNITDSIDKSRVIKIPNTGHYLFREGPHETYLRMCEDIGQTLVLTSGIRSIVKQTKLFLDKLHKVNGNLAITSKSLAPPAFTYHTVADFDVGKKGFGYANFTSRFALTQEFFKMRRLDYIDIRYTVKNLDGVRYEPWHVKVI